VSLKAKIEAVIYASEEPVTLAQLVGLLGGEVQAELDRQAETQQALSLVDVVEPGFEDANPAEPRTGETNPEAAPRELAPEIEAEPATDTEPPALEPPAPESDPGPAPEPDAAAADKQAARAERARMQRVREHLRGLLDRLVAEYASAESDRGIEIREVAGGYRLATKPEYHDAVRGFVKSLKPPLKLTLQALETLAVVAYKQPVTAPEISEIRGVDSGGVLVSLLSRKLIRTAGRKKVIGRPMLYETTKDFLLKFGLKDLGELPSIEEFEKMAGEMAEQEEIPMETGPDEAPQTEDEKPQAEEDRLESDGVEESPASVADELIVDGRESGLPPASNEADNPSAEEAAIQESDPAPGSNQAHPRE
jgi:segregation and condensation protein B